MPRIKQTLPNGTVRYLDPDTREYLSSEAPPLQPVPGMESLGGTRPNPPGQRFPAILDPAKQDTLPVQMNSLFQSMVGNPAIKAGLGAQAAVQEHATPDQRLKGAMDALRGGAQVIGTGALPSMVPQTLKQAGQLALGGVGMDVGKEAGSRLAKDQRMGPGAASATETALEAALGAMGYNIPNLRPGAFMEMIPGIGKYIKAGRLLGITGGNPGAVPPLANAPQALGTPAKPTPAAKPNIMETYLDKERAKYAAEQLAAELRAKGPSAQGELRERFGPSMAPPPPQPPLPGTLTPVGMTGRPTAINAEAMVGPRRPTAELTGETAPTGMKVTEHGKGGRFQSRELETPLVKTPNALIPPMMQKDAALREVLSWLMHNQTP